MKAFAKLEKPTIVGSPSKGFLCRGSLTYGIGLTAKEAYMHWKTMVQVRAMRAK